MRKKEPPERLVLPLRRLGIRRPARSKERTSAPDGGKIGRESSFLGRILAGDAAEDQTVGD